MLKSRLTRKPSVFLRKLLGFCIQIFKVFINFKYFKRFDQKFGGCESYWIQAIFAKFHPCVWSKFVLSNSLKKFANEHAINSKIRRKSLICSPKNCPTTNLIKCQIQINFQTVSHNQTQTEKLQNRPKNRTKLKSSLFACKKSYSNLNKLQF